VVQVHGCFWHRCPHCAAGKKSVRTNTSYWLPKLARNQARDVETTARLEEAGWRVFTIWECQVEDERELLGLAERLKNLSSRA
jgi:DNA mismatch endonuclease (patch repair protein)